MTEGTTCYERDEAFCEDQMCLRTGCRIRNEKSAVIAEDIVIALDDDAPTCTRCGAIVHDPCTSDDKQRLCSLPSFCFPSGRERLLRTERLNRPAQRAPEPANGLPTLDGYRNNLIEECAKVAENVFGGKAHTYASENADLYRAQDAVCKLICAKIRALSVTSTNSDSPHGG